MQRILGRIRDLVKRHVPHPYIALLATLSAVLPIAEIISWISNPAWITLGYIPLVIHMAVLAALVIRPSFGSIAVAVLIAIDELAPIPSPSSMVFPGMVAVAYLSYARLQHGVTMSLALALLSMVSMWMYPQSALRAGGGYGFALIYLLCAGIGIMWRIDAVRSTQQLQNTILRGNARVAQHLHDFTTNDLSNIILLIDRERHGDGTDPQHPASETLDTIRNLACDALRQTRKVIITLEQPYDGSAEQRSADTGIEQALFELVDEQQDILESLGFDGTVVIPDHHLPIADPRDGRLVVGFLKELFGNVARHADPTRGYTVVITAGDGWLTITVSDSPLLRDVSDSSDAEQTHARGTGSGLARYRAAIESRHGTWSLESLDSQWTLGVRIPLAANPVPRRHDTA